MNCKQTNRTYAAIDLKSFYASVEARERNLDPLTVNLVVADGSRTSKTICLAVSPSLKKYGLSGRSRLFEVEQKAAEIKRRTGKDLEYIVATPRMSLYIEYSTKIYQIYLKYFSPEDIHVYSIDEVFIDLTNYLPYYKMSAHQLIMKVIQNILRDTGITATAGIAPNLYLCKIAMDIEAKHIPADKDGVRIAELDEMSYREKLWDYKPITDFWRVGKGTAKRLAKYFMFTMGDIARMSLKDENLLYKIFGIDAEILIDHAWGYEPVEMKNIKSYKSEQKSLTSGQVLHCPYDYTKARIIIKEMAELLALDLYKKKFVCSSITLTVGYDCSSLENNNDYNGDVVTDFYGRRIPTPAHGTESLGEDTNSSHLIVSAAKKIFDRTVNPKLLVRRVHIFANGIIEESNKQPTLFDNIENNYSEVKESNLQSTRLELMKKFGKNALLKGMNLEEGATTRERNCQIGGHKA